MNNNNSLNNTELNVIDLKMLEKVSRKFLAFEYYSKIVICFTFHLFLIYQIVPNL